MLLVFIDKVAELAEGARSKGAAVAPAETKGGEGPMFQKFLDSLCGPLSWTSRHAPS